MNTSKMISNPTIHLYGKFVPDPPIKGLGRNILILTWTGCFIGMLMLALRTYVNAFIIRRWTFDFWFALSTFVTSVAMSGMLSRSIFYGLGTHTEELMALNPGGDLVVATYFYKWMASLFYILSILLGKLAIICFLVVISGQTLQQLPHRKWSIYGLGAGHVVLSMLMIPLLWTQCNPEAENWDSRIIWGKCPGRIRYQRFAYFWGTVETIVDVALAVYPVFIFWELHMRLAKKIGLIILFSTGIFAAVTSVAKIYYLSALTTLEDRTYELALLTMWEVIEIWVVFTASCFPTVKPFFVKIFPPRPPVSAFDIPADDVTNTYHTKVTSEGSKPRILRREADYPLSGIQITEEVDIQVQKQWRFNFHVACNDFFSIKS